MAESVLIPAKLYKKLSYEASKQGKAVEELLLELLGEKITNLDPDERVDLHIRLCDKYLENGRGLLAEGDLVQASEKFWGASAQAVKAVAAKRGLELRSHGELWSFIAKIQEELDDPEVGRLWHVANSLHTNFYEAWAPRELVEGATRDVEKLIEKLKSLI